MLIYMFCYLLLMCCNSVSGISIQVMLITSFIKTRKTGTVNMLMLPIPKSFLQNKGTFLALMQFLAGHSFFSRTLSTNCKCRFTPILLTASGP